MNCLIKIGLTAVVLLGSAPLLLGQAPDAAKDLQDAAGKLQFYSVVDFYLNAVPGEFLKDYYGRLDTLRKQDHSTKDLIEQLKHANPKVRTLAAHLLFQRGDPKLLPHLVPLTKDKAETFGRPRPSATGALFNKELPELDKQTVGQVASTMVQTYLSPAGYHVIEGTANYPGFDDYWAKRKDRAYCASWFGLELSAASRNTNPTIVERIPAIKEVRRRVDKIPEPDRTFTLLWLRDRPGADAFVTHDELVAACKKLGPEPLLKLLAHKIPTDDPDLQSRRDNNSEYMRMIRFVLENARTLLRPEDADALIEYAGRPERTSGAHTPGWYLAAIELQPGKTKELLAKAWQQIEKSKASGASDAYAKLGEAVWKRVGEESLEFAVNMYYHQQPRRGDIPNARDRFLLAIQVRREFKPAERKLIAAIIHDKRFETLDWQSLYGLAWSVNSMQKEHVLTKDDLEKTSHPLGRGHYPWELERARKEFPRETEQLERTLTRWRQTLRQAVPKDGVR